MNANAGLTSLPTFVDWIFKDKRNKIVLWVATVAILAQLVAFKYMYPRAGFINADSYVYIRIAYLNLDVHSYMVGYGRFLRLFSVFSKSDTALVTFQYFLLQASALYFLFTIFYFYRPGKIVQATLFIFIVLNPLFLYMANYISSDAFFLALSFIWFTLLLWIIHRPSIKFIIWHTLIVFIAFTVRYNALIYPFIAAIAFFLTQQHIKFKVIGFIAGILFVGLFILYTGDKFKESTGKWQYSPFSGWQLANNALYAYRYVKSENRKRIPDRFRQLDKTIRTYFDSTRDIKRHPEETLLASTIYMWDQYHSPLYIYRNLQYSKVNTTIDPIKWASIAPLYADYGIYIIRQYPSEFIRYFLWPNASRYFSPPVEYLGDYNMGRDTVSPTAKTWFEYKTNKVTTRFKDFKVTTLDFYPILTGIMNVVFLFGFICFFSLNGFRQPSLFKKGLLLVGSTWVINAGFTIFASSVALRFQAFPVLLMYVFAILLVEFICKAAFSQQESAPVTNYIYPEQETLPL